ncbi:MAG: hypothetical protein HY974_00815 [Candidatus Kerfeldbacteria bacterium]|nr:hypothetical protein [Candidatus Kerfeldbacteria bacterium]
MSYYPSINGRGVRSRLIHAHSWKSRQQKPLVKKQAGSLLRGLSVLFFDDDSGSTNFRLW